MRDFVYSDKRINRGDLIYYLEEDEVEGRLDLKCKDIRSDTSWYIIGIEMNGKLLRHTGISSDLGLRLDETGKVIE